MHLLGFQSISLGFAADFSADRCLGWMLMVAAYDSAFGFYRTTLCVSMVFVVAQCLSVRHVGVLYLHG